MDERGPFALLGLLLPRDATQSAVLLRQVVRLSVALRYHGHIGWNCSKIISFLISRSRPTSPIYSKFWSK